MSNITPESAERISALMDGKLRGQEFSQALHELAGNGQARAHWDTYHVIGQSLRAGDATWQGADVGFVSRLSERLKRESVQVAAVSATPIQIVQTPSRSLESANRRYWQKTVGLASLVLLAVVSWQASVVLLPSDQRGDVVATRALQEKSASVQGQTGVQVVPESALLLRSDGTSVLADNTESALMIRDPRLDAYLAAHRGFAGASVLQVDPGFVQSATFDGGRR